MSAQSTSDRFEKRRQALSSLKLSYEYQYVLAGVLAIFVIRYAVISIYNFFALRHRKSSNEEKGSSLGSVPNPSAFSTVRRFDRFLQQPVGMGFPGSWSWTHLILTTFVVGLNIAFCLITTVNFVTPETRFSNITRALTRRTGRVAMQNLPALFLLFGRNNIITFLTGISYQETRFLHKLIGLIVWIETIIHTFGQMGYYLVSYGPARLHEEYLDLYFQMGIVGTVGGTMCLLGIHYFRSRHYEFFLVSHILGAAMYLAGIFYHYDLTEKWVLAAAGIWIAERVSRYVRHFAGIAHNKLYLRKPIVKARAQVLHGAVILNVPYPHGGWSAGQHVYVSFWGLNIFARHPVETHPFSIVNASRPLDDKEDSPQELDLIIRFKGGVTKTLAQFVGKNSTGVPASCFVKISMEGPYGYAPSPGAEEYETVVGFAGGSGITHPASIIDYLSQKVERKLAVTSRIKLVWAIQHLDQMSWIKDQLVRCTTIAQAAEIDFSVDIYATRLDSSSDAVDSLPSLAYEPGTTTPRSVEDIEKIPRDSSSENGEKLSVGKLSGELSGVNVHHGRPDVTAIMRENVQQSSGRTLVVGCGPVSMVDDIRQCAVELASHAVTIDIASFEC